MTYTIQYNPQTGAVIGIQRSDGAVVPIAPGNADFQAFLAWNQAQPTPLDYATPTKPTPLTMDQQTAAIPLDPSTVQALCAAISALSTSQPVPAWALAIISPVAAAANQVQASALSAQQAPPA